MGNYVFEFSGSTYLFDKDENDRDKYIVFTCAKNEDDYILEFVEHYLALGFDKIIIADNNDDQKIIERILIKYILSRQVQIFNCRGLKKFQLYIYNMFLKEGNYKWCAYFDCDEFLELSVHPDIKGFLEGIKEDCVLINWMVYGSCGKLRKEKGSLKERFKEPVTPLPFFKENYYVKPIIRGGNTNYYLINTHCPIGGDVYNLGGYSTVNYSSHVYYPPKYKYAHVKHYYTKSFGEWMSGKVSRGWPDEMLDLLKPTNYFIIDHNNRFEEEKFLNGFFIDNKEFSEKRFVERNSEIKENYEVIVLYSSTNNLYSLVLNAVAYLKYFKNQIIVIKSDLVDDALYDYLLGYSMNVGGRLCFAFNDFDISMTMWNRATWNKDKYYYIDCQ